MTTFFRTKSSLEFTKVDECHYCGDRVLWVPYSTVNGSFITRAGNLDRKDNSKPYTTDNCVVCCFDCNNTKSNKFSYEEFMLLSPTLRQIRLNRLNKGDKLSG